MATPATTAATRPLLRTWPRVAAPVGTPVVVVSPGDDGDGKAIDEVVTMAVGPMGTVELDTGQVGVEIGVEELELLGVEEVLLVTAGEDDDVRRGQSVKVGLHCVRVMVRVVVEVRVVVVRSSALATEAPAAKRAMDGEMRILNVGSRPDRQVWQAIDR